MQPTSADSPNACPRDYPTGQKSLMMKTRFLSKTTFSPDGMLGSTAGVPQSASASATHSGIAISPRW